MGWWKLLVKQESITPSEAWAMSVIDAIYLVEMKSQKDTSLMVNTIRKMNGATSKYLVEGV